MQKICQDSRVEGILADSSFFNEGSKTDSLCNGKRGERAQLFDNAWQRLRDGVHILLGVFFAQR